MAENTENPLSQGLEGIGYTPFGSTQPDNELSSDTASPVDTDYTSMLADVANTDISVPDFQTEVGEMMKSESGPQMPPMQYANPREIEKYIYQENFQGEGFNPFDSNNYDRWVAKEDWSSALSKGWDSFKDKFGHTYADYWKDYGRMVSALAHGDADNLLPSEEEMLSHNYAEHLSAMKNFVFIPEEDEDLIFSKRSISEFVGNAGFALGTFAALSTELVADALITLATGGAGVGAFGATFARVGGKLLYKAGAKAGKEAVKGAGKNMLKKGIMAGASKEAAKEGLKKGNFFTGLLLADESLDVIKTVDNLREANKLMRNRTVSGDMKKAFSEIFGMNLRAATQAEGFLNKAWEISKGVPLAGNALKYGEKAVVAAKAGRGFGEVAGIGFKGLRRVAQEYNLAATEAAFEAVSSYGATMEQMIDQHLIEGKELDPVTFEKMREMAGNAAFSNYGTNLAILLATNQIQFGTLFNKMGPSMSFVKEMLEEGAQSKFVRNIFNTAKGRAGTMYDTSGFFGIYGKLGKIAKEYGKKQAAYEVGRSFAKGLMRFEVTEGLQENMQEMSNSAWKNYYAGRVNGVYKTLDRAFEEGAAEQFTAQGFRTFLQGALTGSFIRGPVHATQWATQQLSEYSTTRAYTAQGKADPVAASKKAHLDNINLFNDFVQHVTDNKVENAVHFAEQMDESMNATEAAANNSDYDFVNARDNAMIKAAFAAVKLNQTGAFELTLDKMGEQMTKEEFEESFGTKLSDTKYESVADFTNSVKQRVLAYTEAYEDVSKRVKSRLVDPFKYQQDSGEFLNAYLTRKVQDEAIEIIAMNQVKASRASERAEKVFQDYNSLETLANSSDYVFRVLSKPENLQAELSNLEAEIRVINETLGTGELDQKARTDLRKQYKEKKEEIKLLNEWVSYWSTREQINKGVTQQGEEVDIKEQVPDSFIGVKSKKKAQVKKDDGSIEEQDEYLTHDKKVKDTFRKLINLKNKQAGIDQRILVKDLQDGFDKVVDFVQLDQDAKDYLSQVESIMNPEAYQQMTLRMEDGKFKAKLMDFADSIQDRLEYTVIDILQSQGLMIVLQMKDGRWQKFFLGDFTEEDYENVRESILEDVIESDTFKNILTLVVNKDLGVENMKYAEELLGEMTTLIKDSLKDHLQEFVPEYRFDEVIDDSVWEKFKADREKPEAERENIEAIPEAVVNSIAERLATAETGLSSLSPRERAIYNAFPGTFDVKVEEIKNKPEETTEEESSEETTVTEESEESGNNEESKETDENKDEEEGGDLPVSNPQLDALYDRLAFIETQIGMGKTTLEDGKDINQAKSEILEEIAKLTGEEIGEVEGEVVSQEILDLRAAAIESLYSPAQADGTVAAHLQSDMLVDPDTGLPKTWWSKQEAADDINSGAWDTALGNLKKAPEEEGSDEEGGGTSSADNLNEDGNDTVDPDEAKKEDIAKTVALMFAGPMTLDLASALGEDYQFYLDNQSEIDDLARDIAAEMVNNNFEEEVEVFEVKDSKGRVIKTFGTKEEADAFEAQMEIDKANYDYAHELLKGKAQKKTKKGRFKNSTIISFFDAIKEEMDKYNATHKKQYTSFESFYNSNKTNKGKVDRAINRYINTSDEIVAKAVDTKDVSSKNKSTQSSKDNQQETSTITFQQEVQNLHNELSKLEMPTTTDKSGQIGIIFPEGTTDFSKFVDTTAEQIAIDQLSSIKFSCKK